MSEDTQDAAAPANVKVMFDPVRMRARIEHALDKCLKIANGVRNVMIGPHEASTLLNLFRDMNKPIQMLLFCPACSLQHVDKEAPEHWRNAAGEIYAPTVDMPTPAEGSEWHKVPAWSNPPHKSHLCHGCGHVWRPCDIPTTGIAALATKGERDGAADPAAFKAV